MEYFGKFGALFPSSKNGAPAFTYILKNDDNYLIYLDLRTHLFRVDPGKIYEISFTVSSGAEVFKTSKFNVDLVNTSIDAETPVNITVTHKAEAIQLSAFNDHIDLKIDAFLSVTASDNDGAVSITPVDQVNTYLTVEKH